MDCRTWPSAVMCPVFMGLSSPGRMAVEGGSGRPTTGVALPKASTLLLARAARGGVVGSAAAESVAVADAVGMSAAAWSSSAATSLADLRGGSCSSASSHLSRRHSAHPRTSQGRSRSPPPCSRPRRRQRQSHRRSIPSSSPPRRRRRSHAFW